MSDYWPTSRRWRTPSGCSGYAEDPDALAAVAAEAVGLLRETDGGDAITSDKARTAALVRELLADVVEAAGVLHQGIDVLRQQEALLDHIGRRGAHLVGIGIAVGIARGDRRPRIARCLPL